MATYFIRVELFDAKGAEAGGPVYHDLHNKMKVAGFKRTVWGPNSKTWYHLPSAMYRIDSDRTASQILTDVFNIATTVWVSPGVLVIEETNYAFQGLREAPGENV